MPDTKTSVVDSYDLYRTIEDREYSILSDEEFAKKLLDIGCPTHVTEWLVDTFRKVHA